METITSFLSLIGQWFVGLYESFLPVATEFLARFSFLGNGGYYERLFEQYFSVTGFIIGFILLLLLYFSSTDDDNKASFVKIVPVLAVIACCSELAYRLYALFGQEPVFTGYYNPLLRVDNIVSGFILTLVVYSCYRHWYHRQAFLFGLAAYLIVPMMSFNMMNTSRLSGQNVNMAVVGVVLAGFLCLIISYRKCFYTSWIWYFGYFVLMRAVNYVYPLIQAAMNGDTLPRYTLKGVWTYVSGFWVDGLVFAAILIIAIIFEKGVLSVNHFKRR